MKVSLYGNLAEAVGHAVDLDVPPGTTVGAARQALGAHFPQTAAILARGGVRGCIGDTIVDDEMIVPDGMELAFFPPLSGG